MKKILFLLVGLVLFPIAGIADDTMVDKSTECVLQQRNVVFRKTQKLRSEDGREIYLYSSGKCELFDGGRLIVTCTYRLQDGDVRLLDEYGNTVYKGSYVMKRDKINLQSLTLGGVRYRAF